MQLYVKRKSICICVSSVCKPHHKVYFTHFPRTATEQHRTAYRYKVQLKQSKIICSSTMPVGYIRQTLTLPLYTKKNVHTFKLLHYMNVCTHKRRQFGNPLTLQNLPKV